MIEIEGYFDNVVFIIYGGLIVGFYNLIIKIIDVVRIEVLYVDIILIIFLYEFCIEDFRRVLFDIFLYKGVV